MNYFIKQAKRFCFALIIALTGSGLSSADEGSKTYMPFILADGTEQSLMQATNSVTDKLKQAGFTIAGQYSPYKNTTILIVTNDALQKAASQSTLGGFGAAQRVSLTQVNDNVQVSFTNPVYMSHAYQMKQDLSDIKSQLDNALGNQKEYGPEDGLSKDDLRDYQYKWLMPYFSDPVELASYSSQELALKKINSIFDKNQSGVQKVYQINITGKEETVIGVNLTGTKGNDCSGDEYIMSRIDFKKIKSSGHLPYEVVISEGTVYTLPAEFRIAINFPDLSMMGDNSFMSIMCAPNAIQAALTSAVGGNTDAEEDDM